MMRLTVLLVLAFAACSSAFAPHAALVTKPSLAGRFPVLHMSDSSEESKSKVAADGTFYDDEVR